MSCFNPWKGFGLVEAIGGWTHQILQTCFNPWKGFGLVEAKSLMFAAAMRFSFNPWKGFGLVEAWTLRRQAPARWINRFNPWKGFGLVEALGALLCSRVLYRVSIPERVLGWLKRRAFFAIAWSKFVSIPERVLGWLKQKFPATLHLSVLFQSLKGFWVGWSRNLDLPWRIHIRFNPWKGFGLVEAKIAFCQSKYLRCFNPWKGFGLVEAIEDERWRNKFLVSIPERVLGWLKPWVIGDWAG